MLPNCQKNRKKHKARSSENPQNLIPIGNLASATDSLSWFLGVHVLFVPGLKDQQCPQGFSVVLSFSQLLINELFNVRIMKDSLSLNSFLAQVIQHELFEIPSQPLRKRYTKSFFLTVDDVTGKKLLRSFFQNVLRSQPIELVFHRQSADKIHHIPIQQRTTHL